MYMVRRLVNYILRCYRQVLTQLKGEKSRRQPPASPVKQLPSSHQQLVNQSRSQAAPPASQQSSQTNGLNYLSQIVDAAAGEETAPQKPSSAVGRTAHSSGFQVLLSEHQYSPSSAVQNLSHQLSHPKSPVKPKADPLKPLLETDALSKLKLSDSSLLKQERLHKESLSSKKTQEISSDLGKQPEISSTDSLKSSSPIQSSSNKELEPCLSNLFIPSTEEPFDQIQFDQILTASDPATAISEAVSGPSHSVSKTDLAQDSQSITKQGVIKLLFKLKKSNWHGYITPHDGSKDIIFHQKYIGDEIFRHLERGMNVEVTAHMTEGKAYADHVRIL